MVQNGNLFDLSGKRALVTGSSRGLGLVLAQGLARAGAHVFVNGRNCKRLDATVASLEQEGLAVSASCFDVTDEEAVRKAIGSIEATAGAVDILVNNAGVQYRERLDELASSDWDRVLGVNLKAPFLVARECARSMISRRKGKIINICSLMSEAGRYTIGPYTAAKGGLKMLTKAMTVDWARFNIQANGIGPGYFKTEMNRRLYEDERFNSWLLARTPAGRWGEPDELVGAAVFLASEASNFVNGQILYVDGGILSSL